MPRVAGRVRRRVWRPGAMILREGNVADGFYMVYAGEAVVTTSHSDNGLEAAPSKYVVKLQRGDTFGGRSHTRQLKADFTVQADECGLRLVTLSLTRKDLDQLGLSTKLRFPKRAGMYEGVFGRDLPRKVADARAAVALQSRDSLPRLASDLQEDDRTFISDALRHVPNLRALVSTGDDWASGLASFFTKRQVAAGAEIATAGESGQEFFLVAEGSIGVFSGHAHSGAKTAEASVHAEKVARLMLRRHQFLQELSEERASSRAGVATSLWLQPSRSQNAGAPTGLLRVVSERVPPKKVKRRATVGVQVEQMKTPGEVSDEDGEKPIVILERGNTYGELSMLYGVKYLYTARVLEDSTIYVLPRRYFRALKRDESPKLEEYCKLLNEVKLLVPLIHAERMELARNAYGCLDFPPGETVLEQGVPRTDPKWYVVAAGSCDISRSGSPGHPCEQLGQLTRGGYFGERSILRGDPHSDFTVKAGPDGLTVLAFEGEILQRIALSLQRSGDDASPGPVSTGFPSMSVEPEEYIATMCSGIIDTIKKCSQVQAGTLEPVAKLGEGGFGDVFLVKNKTTQQQYALKQISVAKCRETGALDQVRTERDIMALIDSPFVVNFCRAFADDINIFFLMEAVTGGHLFGLLCDHPDVLFCDNPRGSAAMFYVACVTLALGYLHERHIAYRDIKMENVLVDSSGYAKLCDMGFARFVLGKTSTFLGTPDYMAPEIIDPPHAHDKNVDWFALGVLACELLTGQGPWDYHSEGIGNPLEMIVAIRECQGAGLPEGLLPYSLPLAKDMVRRLLSVSPRSRLGSGRDDAEEVRRHAWFASRGFDWQALLERRLPSPWRPPDCPRAAPSGPPAGWAMNVANLRDFV